VQVTQPIEVPVVETREYTGHLQAVEKVEVRARVRAVLQKVHFQEGARVEKGDLLYELDPSEYQAEVDEQRAEVLRLTHELHLAEADARRSSELYARNAISREDHDARQTRVQVTRAELEKARAAVKQAELSLSYTKIYAPISGRIGRTLVTEGNLVGYIEPTLLTTLVTMDPVYVYFEIPERDLLQLEEAARQKPSGAPSAPLAVGLENEQGYPHSGRVDFRDNQVDSGTGTVLVRAVLPNPDQLLIPGLFARVQMPVGEPQPRLLLPQTALGADLQGRYVLVVSEDGTVEQRPVQVAMHSGREGFLTVEQGITLEDRVVVNGLQRARPGSKVDPQLVPSQQIVSRTAPPGVPDSHRR
jgi:multidrug efflux system membrane fusion protein